MRAILIDPRDTSITEVDYDGNYKSIYAHIGADCFDCVRFGDENENTIYVDDEGFMNGCFEREGMFRVEGDNPAYLAGRGLILGTANGKSVACDLSIEELKSRIAFGLPIGVKGHMEFLELAQGEEPGLLTYVHNRSWPIEN